MQTRRHFGWWFENKRFWMNVFFRQLITGTNYYLFDPGCDVTLDPRSNTSNANNFRFPTKLFAGKSDTNPSEVFYILSFHFVYT